MKCLLDEVDSAAARAAVAGHPDWIAPDLIFLEVASVALKSMRRGLIDRTQAEAMVANLKLLVVDVAPSQALADPAFQLAADHGFSAYDATYLTLADARGIWVLTADLKLADRARNCGLGKLVRTLDQP